MRKIVSLSIQKELDKRLTAAARKAKMSKSAYVRKAVEACILGDEFDLPELTDEEKEILRTVS